MELKRKQFTFYGSFEEAAQRLPEDDRGQWYAAIVAYALYGAEPSFTGASAPLMEMGWTLAKPNLVSSEVKSEAARSRAERKGGAPKGNQNARKASPPPEEEPDPEFSALKREAMERLGKN